MKEFRLTDAELQNLLAPALRACLRLCGFKTGRPMDARGSDVDFLLLPVSLDLAGVVTIERDAEGVWIFRQVDSFEVFDRTRAALASHAAAVAQTLAIINRED